MQYVVTGEEMKTYDRRTIEEIGIPSMVLMERAALATVDVILERFPAQGRVLVVAGAGNNGGDGFAIGRLLARQGIEVDFLFAGKQAQMTPETGQQMEIVEHLGFSIQSKMENREYNMVIDALLGIGLSREITGEYKELIESVNSRKERGTLICSVDIPSGVHADSGRVMGCAVCADFTVTYGYAKRGLLLYPGKTCAGELFIRDIGIGKQSFGELEPTAFCFEKKDVAKFLPLRKPDGNKGTFGKVLLVAGSLDICGACLLCGESILRTGAGMVKIITPDCNREIIQEMLPEAMLSTYGEMPDAAKVLEAIEWADVIVAGPGIGTGETAYTLLKIVLEAANLPTILDADALNLIAEHEELEKLARERTPFIVTPHPGELVRLQHTTMEEYTRDRERMLASLAEKLDCVVAGKDAVTLVMGAGTPPVYINTSGNDGMATAGSGDVLAGIIGGLLAQKTEPFLATCLGVYIHGLAADAAVRKTGNYGMIASDIIEELPFVMSSL